MSLPAGTPAELGTSTRRLVRLRIWLAERLRVGDSQLTLLWAALVGLAGAWTSIGFKEATEWLHALLTGGHAESYVESFKGLPDWKRIAVPAFGGLLAGTTLWLGSRYKAKAHSADYMEAVVVGDGNLAVRVSLVKSVSAWFSSASGASIGREGPLVQLSSLAASLAGRWLSFPLARKRQLVACGAAAGIASAYNAPIAGAFFVAEIVLGSMAMEAFGPLVIASIVATLVTRSFYGTEAIYPAPVFVMNSNAELLAYLLLGLASGLLVPVFLRLLKAGEACFDLLRLPAPARLMLGGLVVGGIAIFHPEVVGNGRALVYSVLHGPGAWQLLAVALVCKLLATAATFGSGAVGGVFTPTLFAGAAWGYLVGVASAALFPWAGLNPDYFALVGMGAFLAASTGAPVMAIIMLFELTLNYQVLIPAVIASGAGYYLCRSMGVRPLYGEALERKGAAAVAQHLATLKVGELVAKDSTCLPPQASFGDVAKAFLQSRHDSLHVVDASDRFLGIVSLHDIKPYLDQPELESLLIARDVMHEETPRLAPGHTMSEALDLFSAADVGRLPVTAPDGSFLGAVTRSDILLFLAGKPRSAEA
ncbi:ClcB-like voltage-gated chloride channel protein [Haloferula sp. BvORR071]|uniref:ClcB-like voltage-gated chloride channel protein n=1 Tax=Haloferula sp. BvORR071 TaxID=1396141 RepID=UPI0006973D33|nr:ClcB-like voltage-gated chloride channel protein [Haloferula sp. BvORR071]